MRANPFARWAVAVVVDEASAAQAPERAQRDVGQAFGAIGDQ
jgi:hypothetical protein